MNSNVPFVPDNAPFTPEQRAWLNGLLAGIFSSAPVAPSDTASAGKRIAVLYASQSGTAEGLARKLARELKTLGHTPAVSTLVGYAPAALAGEPYALILASTYGDGDAPDGVGPFYEQLCLEHFPRMESLHYSVFALGDRHYEHFCKFGADLDTKLASLGGNAICKRVDCDVDVEEPFAEWKKAVIAQLNKPRNTGKHTAPASVGIRIQDTATQEAKAGSNKSAVEFSRENPLLAPLVEKRRLTNAASTKLTLHLAFSTVGTGLSYYAGDACGVIPKNDPNLVAEILQRLRFNGNERVQCGPAGSTTLHDALLHHLQITRLNRKMVQAYANRSKCTKLLELLPPEHKASLEQYIYDRGLIDLLVEFPGVIDDPADLVAILPRLTPRLYSIASSPIAHAGQIHATVAVVRYTSHNRERGGVCSTLFADRTSIAESLPIYIQPNKKFRLPANPDTPMIMIGPGTGIAPFRGFLYERRALGHKGRNWLFFGERRAASDFLYRDEFEAMLADGHLARLDTAFSRDQENKVYVQDRMMQNSKLFWDWLKDGANVYVCGDASHMGKDVHATLQEIIRKEGNMSAECAEDYVSALKEQHRYHRDLY
jgi:sulfite reductase (NADPH) flavoprotein alpha-component